MILKIKENLVTFVLIKNGEPLLLVIEDISSEGNIMTVRTGIYPESTYLANPKTARNGHIVGINNTFTFDTTESGDNHYSTNAIYLIKEHIKTKLGLVDEDFEFFATPTWIADKEEYPIRITFPIKEILAQYALFIANEINKPQTEGVDSITLYVKQILPEHDFVREDRYLIIEEL